MEDLIPLINRLQSVFKTTGLDKIELPEIVVIGAQSSGKSSVLESLVKKPILPRGTGIVTRCPIIIQLNQIKPSSADKERCIFSNTSNKEEYTDFDLVREAIEKLQCKMTGGVEKGISMEPIILEVFSKDVIDLTVVDLPGFVKVALPGQPEDIEQQVDDMIMTKIGNKSALILAVSPATNDIATSESLKAAKKVDPNGDRTLGVLTKLDLMDKGTDAVSVLRGDSIKVKLGMIGVVNRSQEDIKNKKTMKQAQEKERKFLRDKYPELSGVGSSYLAKRLNALLTEHIHKSLPGLVQRIRDLTKECEKELLALGKEMPTSQSGRVYMIMDYTTKFTTKFKEMVTERPRHIKFLRDTIGNRVIHGDQFPQKLDAIFSELRNKIAITENNFSHKVILDSLRGTLNPEGYQSVEEVFKSLVRDEIEHMANPAIQCAQNVRDLIAQTANKCFINKRLTALNNVIQETVENLLKTQLEIVEAGISEYVCLQQKMIFSNDKEFIKLLENKETEDAEIEHDHFGNTFPISSRNNVNPFSETTRIRELIVTYLRVVKRELCDYIPKYVMYHLAWKTMDQVSDRIQTTTLNKEERLVNEPDDVKAQRINQMSLLAKLKEADNIIH